MEKTGDYATELNISEYEDFKKQVKVFMAQNDIRPKDLARYTGYSVKTVYDALTNYSRCSRFFVAMVLEMMRGYEKNNSNNSGDSFNQSTKCKSKRTE